MPEQFSPELKEVIGHMLTKDPSKRPTAEQLLSYKFFATD
jgi:serine/threonine protein kinase